MGSIPGDGAAYADVTPPPAVPSGVVSFGAGARPQRHTTFKLYDS